MRAASGAGVGEDGGNDDGGSAVAGGGGSGGDGDDDGGARFASFYHPNAALWVCLLCSTSVGRCLFWVMLPHFHPGDPFTLDCHNNICA